MQKLSVVLLLASMLMAAAPGCTSASAQPTTPVPAASILSQPAVSPSPEASVYKDGTYEYVGKNDSERYFVTGKLTISGGRIVSAEWAIYDANRNNKVFDKDYETVFAGNDVYIQQCRDNLKGMETYLPKLVETQDIGKVDAVTGATWAYHKFEELVKAALKQAEKK